LRRDHLIGLAIAGGVLLYWGEPIVENAIRKVAAGDRQVTYDELVWAVAVNYNLDPDVLRAIIRTESNWKPDAVSLDGQDIGLAQIRIGTARLFLPEWKSLSDDAIKTRLFDPQVNLDMAGRVLAELTAHGLGSSPAIFHAWNVGETKYRKGTRSPFVDRYVVAYNDYSSEGSANA
jgi:soluble lytic murein transglycosylase-like protein